MKDWLLSQMRRLGTREIEGPLPSQAQATSWQELSSRYRLFSEPGHFYSPVTGPAELEDLSDKLWPELPPQSPGIDYNDALHHALLSEHLPPFLEDFDYPVEGSRDSELTTYYRNNDQFGVLDAKALFSLLRHWQPRRMIEVGSGYSTLIALDVNRRFLGNRMEFTSIEPYPRAFLVNGNVGLKMLRTEKVQFTPLAVFEELQSGDALFIDSSHVLKTGSDLTYLLTEVLPRLARGVKVHFHDIFLPDDYPKIWAITQNRSWNEQYALQAMLAHSSRYKVLFGSQYACRRFPELAAKAFGLGDYPSYVGGSFWLEVQ